MGQAAELLEIDHRVVFTPSGVPEDISLPERRRHRPIDATGDPEAELRHPAAEGDSRLLGREPAVEQIARHRLAAERVGSRAAGHRRGLRSLLERRRRRIVGEQVDGVGVSQPFGDDLLIGVDGDGAILAINARRRHDQKQADEAHAAGAFHDGMAQ